MKETAPKKYSVVRDDSCMNYRDISKIMTRMGYVMNHCSARNNFLRAMRRFALEFAGVRGITLNESQIWHLIGDAKFQDLVADLVEREILGGGVL